MMTFRRHYFSGFIFLMSFGLVIAGGIVYAIAKHNAEQYSWQTCETTSLTVIDITPFINTLVRGTIKSKTDGCVWQNINLFQCQSVDNNVYQNCMTAGFFLYNTSTWDCVLKTGQCDSMFRLDFL
jgi:hypothetical protein